MAIGPSGIASSTDALGGVLSTILLRVIWVLSHGERSFHPLEPPPSGSKGVPGGATTWLPPFAWHQGEKAGRNCAEDGVVTAPKLTIAELVQGKDEMEESMAWTQQKREGRRDVQLH
jgi:hypothetical protein